MPAPPFRMEVRQSESATTIRDSEQLILGT
ncbi:MAG: hypothetical protein JWO95_2718 [Verrucomicrobiales bacterium]|nr:hypothetical protein [Verrucomicrobiales bacterium]